MTSILKADTIQDAAGNNIINESSNTITIGASGDTISIPSGATIANSGTATGFGIDGITMADTFNLTSSASGSLTPISSNLARSARTGQGGINPGMTESSGIFTFPSSGVYYVTFTTSFQLNGDSRYVFINIQATTNNSSYSAVAETVSFIQQTSSSTTYAQAQCSSLIDVTDTSNVKVKFHVAPENSSLTTRGGAQSETFMTFIRLGDT